MAVTVETLRLYAEAQAQLTAHLDAQTAALVAAWVQAWDEVAPDLADTLADLMLDTVDGVVSAAAVMRSERLINSLRIIADRLDDLTAGAAEVITGDLQGIVQDAADTQAGIVASMMPDGWDAAGFTYVHPATLDAIVQRSTEQIHSGLQPLTGDAVEAMRGELVRGVAAGSGPRDTAARIVDRCEGHFNGGLTRALVISRTETVDAHRAGGAAAHDANAELMVGWIWLCHLGPRVCRGCLAMHGTVHALDEPGPRDHQQGRCARVPKLKSWADLGVEGLDDLEPPDVTPDADAFFAALSPDEQRAILGDRGYRLWKAGKWPRSEWARLVRTAGWRDSWAAAPPPRG